MRWRYRSYRYSKPKFFFSGREIDFTKLYLDYEQFLLQEFFEADLETRKNISRYYRKEYGDRAFGYLKSKYSEWANGQYHLTDLMKDRILSIMPLFLNEKARHNLGTHDFMSAIKQTVINFVKEQKSIYSGNTNIKNTKEVVKIFEKELKRLQNLKAPKFRFNVLTEDEKEEAMEIGKYILAIKLQKSFDQIEHDFKVFLSYIHNLVLAP